MLKSIKVSIALATCNGGHYLKEQLRSFVDQSEQPDELVIYDDCSDDETLTMLNLFEAKTPFKVIVNKNLNRLGYTLNFDKSLERTTGKIVFLSDQDDVWFDKKIATVLTAFEENPQIYLIIHDLSYCDEMLRPVGQTKLERMKSIGAGDRSYVTGMATAVKKEFLDICLPIPANHGITHDLWLHECAYALNIKKVIPDVLAWYRRHDKTATNTSVINRVKKTNFFSFIRRQDINEKKGLMQRRIALLQQLIHWSRRTDVALFCKTKLNLDKDSLDLICNKISTELDFAERRLKLFHRNRITRALCAIKLYFEGGYGGVMGMKSLLKDIIS
jgi:glycosyltransferase involved in cell wall biosynthesis